MTGTYRMIGATVLSGALLMTPASPRGQAAAEVFTATASVKTAGGASASAPVTITIDRKMPQSEADSLVAAFKTGGAAALRKALVGDHAHRHGSDWHRQATPTRFTIERVTGDGRLLTILTDQPLAFLGAGVPGAKPKEGYDFAVIDIEVDAKGSGSGTIAPAAKIKIESGRVRRGGLRRRGRPADGGQEDKVGRSRLQQRTTPRTDHRMSGGATAGGDPGSPPAEDAAPKTTSILLIPNHLPDFARWALRAGTTCDVKASRLCLCAPKRQEAVFDPPCRADWWRYFMSIGAACAERNVTEAHVNRFGSSIYSPTDVDAAIHEAQRCIVEALDLDGSTLFERSDDGDLLGTHGWWRPEVPAPPARVSARESFPWMLREAPGRRVGLPLEPRRTAGRRRPRHLASLRPQVARRGPAAAGAADRRRRELRRDAQRAAVAARDTSAPAPRGEHVRQRARPPARATRRSRLALAEVRRLSDQLRAENVYLRREVDSTLGTSRRRPERRDSPRARAGAPGGRDRCDGAPAGRDRLRQGGVRVADS